MKAEVAIQLIDTISEMLNTIQASELNTWSLFVKTNSIVSTFDDLDCLMSINFANGLVCQGLCVITDGAPGLVVLKSDEGELPKVYTVSPEDTSKFMKSVEYILEPKYPELSE